jgi:Uma2 family endonuclease
MLQRWVEHPGGGFELLEMPLTLELYLNPRLGDKLTQGELHADLMAELKELLGRHFRHQRDVKVLMDVKHQFSPRRGPSPDISIVRGVRNPDLKRSSFNVVKEGVVPSLVIEILSPFDARVRRMDEVDKVKLYERVGIPEYVLGDPAPRQNVPESPGPLGRSPFSQGTCSSEEWTRPPAVSGGSRGETSPCAR